jgi:regulator of CtrA degradation
MEDQSTESDMARANMALPDGLPATTFFSKTYDEAKGLVEEARDYVRDHGGADSASLPSAERIFYACETMRLTARLTQVMSWLLLQRALHAGEITREDLREDADDLSGAEVCLAESEAGVEKLPAGLVDLLSRSESLYTRVARLNEMVAGGAW